MVPMVAVGVATITQPALGSQPTKISENTDSLSLLEHPEPHTTGHGMRGMQVYARRVPLHSSNLVILSVAAVLAMTFMILQCFTALGSRKTSGLRVRRLAEGGSDEGTEDKTCNVSACSDVNEATAGWGTLLLPLLTAGV